MRGVGFKVTEEQRSFKFRVLSADIPRKNGKSGVMYMCCHHVYWVREMYVGDKEALPDISGAARSKGDSTKISKKTNLEIKKNNNKDKNHKHHSKGQLSAYPALVWHQPPEPWKGSDRVYTQRL